MIRLASFNVNSIRRRVPHLRRFLDRRSPDLVFLQELKCQTAEFPRWNWPIPATASMRSARPAGGTAWRCSAASPSR